MSMPVSGSRRGDDAADVAVADQHDARAGGAHLGDQLGVARPVEDADDQVGDLARSSRCARFARFVGRLVVEIDDAVGQPAADRDLVHVDVGRVEEAAVLGHRDDRQRVGAALGGDRRAFQRIERDVDLRALPGADLLADIEHRRLVALALADHHGAVDRQAVERLAHRVDRGLVGRLLVAAPHQPRGGQRRRLGDAHRFQRQIAIHLEFFGHASSSRRQRRLCLRRLVKTRPLVKTRIGRRSRRILARMQPRDRRSSSAIHARFGAAGRQRRISSSSASTALQAKPRQVSSTRRPSRILVSAA